MRGHQLARPISCNRHLVEEVKSRDEDGEPRLNPFESLVGEGISSYIRGMLGRVVSTIFIAVVTQ